MTTHIVIALSPIFAGIVFGTWKKSFAAGLWMCWVFYLAVVALSRGGQQP